MSGKYNGMKRARDWIGQRVELVRPVGNGYMQAPEGYRGAITQQNTKGLVFEGDACACCGLKPRITGLGYYTVRLAVSAPTTGGAQ